MWSCLITWQKACWKSSQNHIIFFFYPSTTLLDANNRGGSGRFLVLQCRMQEEGATYQQYYWKDSFLNFQRRRMCGSLAPNRNGNRIIYRKLIIWIVGEFMPIGQFYSCSYFESSAQNHSCFYSLSSSSQAVVVPSSSFLHRIVLWHCNSVCISNKINKKTKHIYIYTHRICVYIYIQSIYIYTEHTNIHIYTKYIHIYTKYV